ncbi:hypothetical protein MC7420_3799 [Coleofasciculus chthonoplastes PCC 7420]|uniref:Uncharacterized protein n=1 Tax=Coleofasciculus chthonoplastes PCC 7420 TaxID=118168 RepID=B4VUE3_9CYAN|nr:hypothetical protein MC7420_3799 [Coleofasciculus chthonoplastes PCC 7420]
MMPLGVEHYGWMPRKSLTLLRAITFDAVRR